MKVKLEVKKVTKIAVAGIGLVTVISGCGSSSAPNKASYNSQANAICGTYNSKLQAAGSALSGSTNQAQAEQSLSSAVTLAQQGTTKLEALKPPSGESAALKKAYGAQQAQVTDLNNALQALKANNTGAFKAAVAAASSSSPGVNQQFDALGLTTCGSGSSSS